MTTPLNGSITLGQAPGTVDEIVRIADGAPIALEKAALDNMARVSSRIQRAIEQGEGNLRADDRRRRSGHHPAVPGQDDGYSAEYAAQPRLRSRART